MLAYIAIGLFAGLRRSELCALEWSEIDRKARTIEVKGVKAKTRQRRIVSVSGALSAWLAVAPKTPRPAPSRNEDVCGERLKNLYSEECDESGTILREAIVSLGRTMLSGTALDRITTPDIAMKTRRQQKWAIPPQWFSGITGPL